MNTSIILIPAFILDIIFKDPKNMPHPVVFMGKLINYLDNSFRKIFKKDKISELIMGFLIVLIVTSLSFLIPFIILKICYNVSFILGIAVEIFLCFQILALGSLKEAGMLVYRELLLSNKAMAGKYLSYIITRDTSSMSEEDMVKATVETVSENTSDGVIAPLFYMVIGGASLGMLYKAVNTLDSMMGYKTTKYLYVGKISAKLDDIFNIIPARITGYLFVASSFIAGLNYKLSYKILRRDSRKHTSPNSGYPESAVAGALGIRLGGNAIYFGKVEEKAYIGDNIKSPEKDDIPTTCMLMYITSILGLLLLLIAKILIIYILSK